VDVRIIAATHMDLPAMVNAGTFRKDLWYRMSVFIIRLPALREHKEDIPELASYFAQRAGRCLGGRPIEPTEADVQRLMAHDWPGNVRELSAVIERAAILGNLRKLEVEAALHSNYALGEPPQALLDPTWHEKRWDKAGPPNPGAPPQGAYVQGPHFHGPAGLGLDLDNTHSAARRGLGSHQGSVGLPVAGHSWQSSPRPPGTGPGSGEGEALALPPLPDALSRNTRSDGLTTLDLAMSDHIVKALQVCKGRIEGPHGAAAMLNINPHTLRARMRKLGIQWSVYRPGSTVERG